VNLVLTSNWATFSLRIESLSKCRKEKFVLAPEERYVNSKRAWNLRRAPEEHNKKEEIPRVHVNKEVIF
jgi:hypothetical protein